MRSCRTLLLKKDSTKGFQAFLATLFMFCLLTTSCNDSESLDPHQNSNSRLAGDASSNPPTNSLPDQLASQVEKLEVCRTSELLRFIEIIKGACVDDFCDLEKLKDIDTTVKKSVLLGALRNPYLRPVHIFFPVDLFEINDILDWNSIKRHQLESMELTDDPGNTIVFIIGKASTPGMQDYNEQLSFSRMKGVFDYLTDYLAGKGVHCADFRVGYLGEQALQFDKSDAYMLNINENDYRGDEYTLNQAVHVFAYPCAELLMND